MVYDALNHLKEAEGLDHPECANMCKTLGSIFEKKKDDENADLYYEHYVNINENLYGRVDRRTISAY